MRKTNLVLLSAVFSIIFFLTNCDKSEDPVVSAMSAKIDGVQWTGSTNDAKAIGGQIHITTMSLDGSMLTITINSLDAGTYTLNSTSSHVATYQEGSKKTVPFTTNGGTDAGGEVVISSINEADSTISGFFSFTVVRASDDEMKTITEGTINGIKYELPSENLVCDGNGEDTYMPLAIGNLWDYHSTANFGNYEHVLVGMKTIEGLEYYEVHVEGSLISDEWDDHYRFDGQNDLYKIVSGWEEDFELLLVPGNPVVGQSWGHPTNSYRMFEVVSLNASTETNECSYENLLQINEYEDGELWYKNYYKKGIGLVNRVSVDFGNIENYLKELELN